MQENIPQPMLSRRDWLKVGSCGFGSLALAVPAGLVLWPSLD